MLKQLSIKNLGCFNEDDHKISFSKETVLVGPNNSGKSIFLIGINILKWFILGGGRPYWNTESYKLTTFENAVYNHLTNRKIEIEVDINDQIYTLSIIDQNRIEYTVNGQRPRIREEDRKNFENIWYMSPNRSSIPFSSSIQIASGAWQPIHPSGNNVHNFLLERWSEQHEYWDMAREWFQKIDEKIDNIRTPIRGNHVFLEMMMRGNIPINISSQGSGIQSIASVISALIFSPSKSIIIIEEPEAFLHSKSKEVIVDLINYVVNEQDKQVIFSSHSWEIMNTFISDIGAGSRRGAHHPKADPDNFACYTFTPTIDTIQINEYDLSGKIYQDVRRDFKELWG